MAWIVSLKRYHQRYIHIRLGDKYRAADKDPNNVKLGKNCKGLSYRWMSFFADIETHVDGADVSRRGCMNSIRTWRMTFGHFRLYAGVLTSWLKRVSAMKLSNFWKINLYYFLLLFTFSIFFFFSLFPLHFSGLIMDLELIRKKAYLIW